MRTLSADDRLIASLSAPPDLGDGVESLRFWRDRARRLPWYRVAARREARLMVERWERRVTAAVLSQRGVPFRSRTQAALLVAGIRLGRLRLGRLRLGRLARLVAVSAMLVLAIPFLLLAVLLVQIF